jgi:hypothetical protein
MIDGFSLLLAHGLILLACWRLLRRDDLDDESGGEALDFQGRPRDSAVGRAGDADA